MQDVTPTSIASAAIRTRRAGLSTLLAGLVLLLSASTGYAALRAELDRTAVQQGETVTLIVEADGMQITGQPDFGPLQKDFRVLGTSVSTQMNLINGSASSRTRWIVPLQPLRKGKLVVPALALGGEKSAPLELEVGEISPQIALQTGQHLSLEAGSPSDRKSFLVGQPIPYTLRLYYDDTLREGGFEPVQAGDAIIEPVGQEKRYATVRNGRPLHVLERTFAITPEKSGSLSIAPVTFSGQMAVAREGAAGRSRMSGLMEELMRNSPFANDPMFKDPLAGFPGLADAAQPVTVQSPAVTLEIRPRPAAVPARDWLPAEDVTVTDSWSGHPPEFRVGEPVTRTITVDAQGLTGTQIPELVLAQPAAARLYREATANDTRIEGETLHGTSKQSITYIPTAQGTLSVPGVELNWWNTRTNSPGRATLPQREFMVQAGIASSQATAIAPAPSGEPGASGQNALPAQRPAAPAQTPRTVAERLRANWPYWAGGGALLLALLGALILHRRRYPPAIRSPIAAPGSSTSPAPPVTSGAALRALREACAANDAVAAASALLALGRAQWPENPPQSLVALAARLAWGGEQTRALDRSLYAARASNWEGAALWAELKDGVREQHAPGGQTDDGLRPLYQ